MRNTNYRPVVVLLIIERPVTMTPAFVIFGEIILMTSVVSGDTSARFRDNEKNGVDNLHDKELG